MSNVPFLTEAEMEKRVRRLVAERGTQHVLTMLDALQRAVGGLVLQLQEQEKGGAGSGNPNQPRDRNGRWTASSGSQTPSRQDVLDDRPREISGPDTDKIR